MKIRLLERMVEERDSTIDVLSHYTIELKGDVRGLTRQLDEQKAENLRLARLLNEAQEEGAAMRGMFGGSSSCSGLGARVHRSTRKMDACVQSPCTYTRKNKTPRFNPL